MKKDNCQNTNCNDNCTNYNYPLAEDIKMSKEEQKIYDRESCDICGNRFNCTKVEDFDNGKDVDLHNCPNFEDAFA